MGTPLEWPEVKKVASNVRDWGIEVRLVAKSGFRSVSDLVHSNCLPSGPMPKARNEMRYCGEMRYGKRSQANIHDCADETC